MTILNSRVIIILLLAELLVLPFLAVADLGLSAPINSNFYARFLYLLVFGFSFLFLITSMKFYLNPISLTFIFFFVLSLCVFIFRQGNINSAFVSHVFYFLMPVVCINYGYFLNDSFFVSFIKKRFIFLYSGFFFTILFILFQILGLANYNAIGLWNFTYALPALMVLNPNYKYLIILGSLLTGKRGSLLANVATISFFDFKFFRNISILGTFLLFSLIYYVNIDFALVGRILTSFNYLAEGSFDLLLSGRLSESVSAINYLLSKDLLFTGAGLGATFLPWPDKEGYEFYLSHYTHLSFVSYIWMGGIFLSVFVYSILIYLLINFRVKDTQDRIIQILVLSFLIISLFGAVLMNNPFLWIFIGYFLKRYKRNVRISI